MGLTIQVKLEPLFVTTKITSNTGKTSLQTGSVLGMLLQKAMTVSTRTILTGLKTMSVSS